MCPQPSLNLPQLMRVLLDENSNVLAARETIAIPAEPEIQLRHSPSSRPGAERCDEFHVHPFTGFVPKKETPSIEIDQHAHFTFRHDSSLHAETAGPPGRSGGEPPPEGGVLPPVSPFSPAAWPETENRRFIRVSPFLRLEFITLILLNFFSCPRAKRISPSCKTARDPASGRQTPA